METNGSVAAAAAATAAVQHVNKASSDQLLRKFAEMGSESEDKALAKKELRLAKRRKRMQCTKAADATANGNTNNVLVERKSLLPPAGSQRSVALIRRLGIGKAKVRARDFKNKSFLGTIEKTWRRTVEGASKVFIEKHYNRHRRLISDTY